MPVAQDYVSGIHQEAGASLHRLSLGFFVDLATLRQELADARAALDQLTRGIAESLGHDTLNAAARKAVDDHVQLEEPTAGPPSTVFNLLDMA